MKKAWLFALAGLVLCASGRVYYQTADIMVEDGVRNYSAPEEIWLK